MSKGISILYTDNPDVLINLGPNQKTMRKTKSKKKMENVLILRNLSTIREYTYKCLIYIILDVYYIILY